MITCFNSKVFSLFSLLISASMVPAASYSANPSNFQSIFNNYAAGDTIYMAEGEYNGKSIYITKPVTIHGAGKGRTIIQYGAYVGRPADMAQCGIRIWNTSNVSINALTVRYIGSASGSYFGILAEADTWTQNLKINSCEVTSIKWQGSTWARNNGTGVQVRCLYPAGELDGYTFTWNDVSNCKTGWSESVTAGGNIHNFTIQNNSVNYCDNIGIAVHGGYSWLRGYPYAGIISNNQVGDITTGRNPAYSSKNAAGIYLDGARSITVRDNETWDCDIGMSVGAESTGSYSYDNWIYKNIVWSAHRTVFEIGGYEQTNDQGGATGFCYGNTIEQNDFKGAPSWNMVNITKTKPQPNISNHGENLWIANKIIRWNSAAYYTQMANTDLSRLGNGWGSNSFQ
jgi:hypothetical protein